MANPRKIALSVLLKIEKDDAYSNIALSSQLKQYDLSNVDKGLVSALVYGVLDRKITLDYILSKVMKSPLKKTAPYTLMCLRMALYQILYMDKIPNSAAVNEAVKLIKGSKQLGNAGFVNAVLRNILRNGVSLPSGNSIEALSIRFSYPQWIIESFIKDYGHEATLLLLEESLKPAPIVLRINNTKTTLDGVMSQLNKEEIIAYSCELEDCLVLEKGFDIENNQMFKNGFFHIQDKASQKAISNFGLSGGERVLDMCAAPGGKSLTMAELMKNTGEIVSCDIYESRTSLIEASAKRLELDIIKPTVQDATAYNPKLGKFDCVLCDVPCSGLGVIRRKPEIKYKKKEYFKEIEEIQFSIISNALKYVKKGGMILYSTCTLRKEENEKLVIRFQKEYNNIIKLYEHTYMPHIDDTDGFYCALLRVE